MERGQAEALMPMIDRVMKAAGVTYAALGRIAVTTGPGSFTGVRSGLAAARGLTLASEVPTVGILTTEALAAAVPEHERNGARILAAIDTKRGDFYVQPFGTDGAVQGAPEALGAEALPAWIDGPVVIVGDAAAARAFGGRATISSAPSLVDLGVLAALASKTAPQPGGPAPVYVHPPAVTLPS